MEVTSLQIALASFFVMAIGGLWGLFKVLGSASENAKRDAEAKIESLRLMVFAEIDKQAALAAKSRHDLANTTTSIFAEVKVDLERLKRETVRREEMSAIETRLTAMFSRSDAKLDLVVERLAQVLVLEKQVTALEHRIDRGGRPQ